jgi:hypothetical protein
VTEKWNQFARIRQDAFGFGDILCFRGHETILVQTTSRANVSARIKKILDIPEAHAWASGAARRIIVHGWGKKGGKDKRKLWECTVIPVLNDKKLFPLEDGSATIPNVMDP